MELKNQLPDLLPMLKGYAKSRKSSLYRISKQMGMAPNYLSQKLKKPDANILLLLELSDMMNVNLLEHYLALLPPATQTTHRERALLMELENMRKELEQVRAERDKYWEVISSR